MDDWTPESISDEELDDSQYWESEEYLEDCREFSLSWDSGDECQPLVGLDTLGDLFELVEPIAPSGFTSPMPIGILLDFGAAARLARWEAAGLTIHRDAGLPSAEDAMGNFRSVLTAFLAGVGSLDGAGSFGSAVEDAMLTRLALTGRQHIGANVVIDVSDDDVFVEAMAQFLWSHRGEASVGQEQETP